MAVRHTLAEVLPQWFGYDRTMNDGPNIARVAGLIGDPARAEILTALLADRALTATELAGIAGVTKQTASGHLAKLVDAGLLAVAAQGRHRYFRLAGSVPLDFLCSVESRASVRLFPRKAASANTGGSGR